MARRAPGRHAQRRAPRRQAAARPSQASRLGRARWARQGRPRCRTERQAGRSHAGDQPKPRAAGPGA
eukprot:5228242-Alexandrium_andersonii.AAC.1